MLGALLPLPAFRLSVPYGDPYVSSCPHCGRSLWWVGPVCPQCTRRVGPPWWATAFVAAVAGVALAWALPGGPVLVVFLALSVVGVLLAFVDVAVQRLPTVVVLPALGAAVAAFALITVSGGGTAGQLGRALLGGLALGAVFLALHLLPGGKLGFGDVQLAVLLGVLLGWLGWSQVLWGALFPWLVNAPVVLVLLALGRVHQRSRVPFGPSLFAGALFAVVVPAALARLWAG